MKSAQHLSVRVPWQDNGWSGSVCADPLDNASCVLLPNIGEKRDDEYERVHAGLPLDQLDTSRIACLKERGTFLSPRSYQVVGRHPYQWKLDSLRPTPITVPAYGVHATPFFWLNRSNVDSVLRDVEVDYRHEHEEFVDRALNFKPRWVMHGDNQRALIESFFSGISLESSLVFFYAKHSPFEGNGTGQRLLVGAARVTGVELPGRWQTDGQTSFPNHMWETSVRHSLRPDGGDGILLPLAELAKLDAEGMDVSSALAWAPNDSAREFSYVTEHVSSDTAIAALDQLFQAARRCAEFGLDVPGTSLDWVSDRIGDLWTTRGPAPGLGAVLTAIGVKYGPMVAREIFEITPEDVDPWHTLVEELESPGRHLRISSAVTTTPRNIWLRSDDTQQRTLKLLSRFQLTADQTTVLFDLDADLLRELVENPYLVYLLLLESPLRVPFDVIDRGCYPSPSIGSRFPLDEPSTMQDATDPRRVQALIVDVLDEAAQGGDTVAPLDRVLSVLAERPLGEPCPVTEQILRAHKLHPADLDHDPDDGSPLVGVRLADGSPAFKLTELHEIAEFIRQWLDNQRAIPRLAEPADLATLVASVLDDEDAGTEAELRARHEKTAALAELFVAPLSVLNGRAGTGKTTLIKALVRRLDQQGRSVLLLAPTGKACVQLQQKVGHQAHTLAQFLSRHGRYDRDTGAYFCDPDQPKAAHYDTVVVDECSMLTEKMLAALLDTVHPPRRLILVGDPRQLPPIGAGRPFVDLITQLTHGDVVPVFPKVTPGGYAELTVLRRQKGQTRDDLKLAAWFSGDEIPDGFDEVWQQLRTQDPMPSLAAIPWDGKRAEAVVEEALKDQLAIDDSAGFELSYGGRRDGEWVNWGMGSAKDCEKWQILSPTRGHAWGTVEVNRRLKLRHRGFMMRRATGRQRSAAKPIGPEQIVVGDKVLNNRNQRRRDGYPKGGLEYIANGEIGVVVGQTGKRGSSLKWTKVEFSSQQGTQYSFNNDDKEDPTLELAWAITIHKSQGSEFGTVFVMLPSSVRRLSREMLYTALTRQQDKVVLLHEGSIDDLLDLTSATGSETARRLTDLFRAPDPKPIKLSDGTDGGLYDANLVHLTANGILVRSKNEVIVSRILDDLAPGAWTYERPLTVGGWTRRPDFTISTPRGTTVYWEHLGMLRQPEYAEKWERKKQWYAQGGILPHSEGGGPMGTLMWTDDTDGVDVPGWTEFARTVIGPGGAVPKAPSRTKRKSIKRVR